MPSVISGLASAVAPVERVVSNVTNATPNVVTTTVAHNLVTGDVVDIFGVVGFEIANGGWTITVISPTTFSLNGSAAGAGGYTSGGTVRSATLQPQFTVPSDLDGPPKASDILVGLEALADRTQFLAAQHERRSLQWLGGGQFIVPAGVYVIEIEGCGGGGGGGGGAGGNNATSRWAVGGGGGGASPEYRRNHSVVPGQVLAITAGAGGTGGLGGAVSGSGNRGANGAASTVGTIATMPGGEGGLGGSGHTTPAIALGGGSLHGGHGLTGTSRFSRQHAGAVGNSTLFMPTISGGHGLDPNFHGTGLTTEYGFGTTGLGGAGGAGGIGGAKTGDDFWGGGPGGGGGGGPYGGGGGGGGGAGPGGTAPNTAGNGGAALSYSGFTAPTAGTNGSNGAGLFAGAAGAGGNAPANSGGGGGGGGGGGHSTLSPTAGAAGGNGGAGRVRITWSGPPAQHVGGVA